MILFELRNVSVGYADYPLIRNISFSIESGKIVSIVGKNAAGKSSLIKALFGREAWLTGTVLFLEEDINQIQGFNMQKFPWMLQNRPIFPNLKGVDVLRAIYTSRNKSNFNKKLKWLSGFIAPLSEILYKESQLLSGGEKAVLSLAMTLINKPKLLFLDEPFAGVDKKRTVELIKGLNKYISQESAGCLLIEHRSEVIRFLDCAVLDLDRTGEPLELIN